MEISIAELNKIRNIPMLFVMGKERSGTTLLQTFLSGHPNIAAPLESEFIILLYPRFGKIKKWREKDVLDFIEALYKEPFFDKLWQINKNELTSTLLSIKEHADYAFICKIIYWYTAKDKENVIILSDKNPKYVLFIHTILKIFPEAKFIHIIRDPRGNTHSHLKTLKFKNARFVAEKWLIYNTILEKSKQHIPEKYETIWYEELVADPEKVMKKLCIFLGIPYSNRMIQNTFPEKLKTFENEKLTTERLTELHASLLKPVNTSNIDKWRTGLNDEDKKIIIKITGAFATKYFNYKIDPVLEKVPFITNFKIIKTKLVYRCWQLFTQLRFRSYLFNTFYVKANLYFGREITIMIDRKAK